MKHFFLAIIAFPALCASAEIELPDSLDYTSEFWLRNRQITERALKEMPWASSVPEREWKNFVEPVRVNNESLDTSRVVFYKELAPRVRNLSMREAALEINHWCHEKVTYRPSDSRTSSPLATMKTSWGRCGEESTFTVAALRAVGIPARQVYTPRWAHTDDNHAWVEVWADGQWHFIGACEPEAILDLAWFNAPAARGMLMNTRVRNGEYDGPEEVLDRNEYITTINVTANYAPVDTVVVRAVDVSGSPVAGANVMFTIYNYAEFYPIAKKVTDDNGCASLTAGRGDMLVWVSDNNGNFGFGKYSSDAASGLIEIALDRNQKSSFSGNLKLVPPVPGGQIPQPTDEQRIENERRKLQEDSIRGTYMSSFITLDKGDSIARVMGLPHSERVARMLRDSYGNHEVLISFLAKSPDKEKAIALLEAISDKDLRDVTSEVLADHYATPDNKSRLFVNYVMNPRVANEMLTPYKSQFKDAFSEDSMKMFSSEPDKLVDWVRNNISVNNLKNPEGLCISPWGVWRHRRDIDGRSRDIFFVSIARSIGIPARIDPVTAKPQWADAEGNWMDAVFEQRNVDAGAKGVLKLQYDGSGAYADPKYYYQFSLSKINNGVPYLLEFDEKNCSWSNTFSDGYQLDAGQYLLVSGQRLAGGGVLVNMNLFEIKPDETATVPLVMLTDDSEPQVIGNFNSENRFVEITSGQSESLLSACGRGYYILAMIKAGHEPSFHLLHELATRKNDIEKLGLKIVLLTESPEDLLAKIPSHLLQDLPGNVILGYMPDSTIADELSAVNLPTVIIADTFNRIVFRSDGYKINLPDTLSEIVKKL